MNDVIKAAILAFIIYLAAFYTGRNEAYIEMSSQIDQMADLTLHTLDYCDSQSKSIGI